MKITFLLFYLFSHGIHAKTLYVRSVKAKLLTTPDHKSEVLTMVSRGDDGELIETKGPWTKIKISGKEGWMAKLVLSTTPPKEKVSLLESKKDLSKKARKRASQFTSAAAARGLVSSNDDFFKGLNSYNYAEVQKLEKKYVPPAKAVNWFLKSQ